jgi:hypothetical protein
VGVGGDVLHSAVRSTVGTKPSVVLGVCGGVDPDSAGVFVIRADVFVFARVEGWAERRNYLLVHTSKPASRFLSFLSCTLYLQPQRRLPSMPRRARGVALSTASVGSSSRGPPMEWVRRGKGDLWGNPEEDALV